MNEIDKNINDLNEIIQEITKTKEKIYKNTNKIIKKEDMIALDVTLTTASLAASAVTCSILKAYDLVSMEKLIGSQILIVGGTLFCSFIYNIYGIIKNREIEADLEFDKTTLDYLENLYQDKTKKLNNSINSNKRVLTKDN